jgi:NAD(P)H dehydrogenase (quinone)
MYAVTGASGQLGRLVIDDLLGRVPAGQIVALVRDPAKLADLASRGVVVRAFDYDAPDTLEPALAGVDRLLLISSNEVGRREAQHRAVIDAAKAAGVGYIAYTSILHADRSPLGLAVEHRATEVLVEGSGIAYALLRNGWYNENYTVGAGAAIAHGAVIGSIGDARVSSASRADYAAAAATLLAAGDTGVRLYELAGDTAFTHPEFAAMLAEASGKPVVYVDMPEAEYRAALEGAGLPAGLAAMLADSSAKAADGALFDDGHALTKLIGRPTTPLIASIRAAL